MNFYSLIKLVFEISRFLSFCHFSLPPPPPNIHHPLVLEISRILSASLKALVRFPYVLFAQIILYIVARNTQTFSLKYLSSSFPTILSRNKQGKVFCLCRGSDKKKSKRNAMGIRVPNCFNRFVVVVVLYIEIYDYMHINFQSLC